MLNGKWFGCFEMRVKLGAGGTNKVNLAHIAAKKRLENPANRSRFVRREILKTPSTSAVNLHEKRGFISG